MPTPAVAMSSPAMAGPKMRDALKRLELSAIALGSSGLPTIWMVNAWRTGVSMMSTDAAGGGEEEHLPDLGAVGEREAGERGRDAHQRRLGEHQRPCGR